MSQSSSFISKATGFIKKHPACGYRYKLGLWIGPGFCVLSEFGYCVKTRSHFCTWIEKFSFADYDQLIKKLSPLVKKHSLHGHTVCIALHTPEIYSSAKVDISSPLENQDIFPPGIAKDSLEYSICSGSPAVFTCIRAADSDMWNSITEKSGLLMHNLIPAGTLWHSFFAAPLHDNTPDNASTGIRCLLPKGVLQVTSDGHVFEPSCNAGANRMTDDSVYPGFSSPVSAEFSWCPADALPAFEPILMRTSAPEFNCNPLAFEADKSERIEHRLWTWLGKSIAVVIVITLLAITVAAGLEIWNIAIGGQRREYTELVRKVEAQNRQNMHLKKKYSEARHLLSQRGNAARILGEISGLSGDSLWFSELNIKKDDKTAEAYYVSVTGFTLSESAISRLCQGAENLAGTGNSKLEYSERLSSANTSKITGGYLKDPIQRFKLNLFIAADGIRRGTND